MINYCWLSANKRVGLVMVSAEFGADVYFAQE